MAQEQNNKIDNEMMTNNVRSIECGFSKIQISKPFPFWDLPRKGDIADDTINLNSLPNVHPMTVKVERHANSIASEIQSPDSSNGDPSRFNPIKARNVAIRVLTSPDAVKEVTSVTFSIDDPRWNCKAGDSFGLCCENDPDAVDSLLDILGLEGSQYIRVTSLGPIMSDSLLETINGRIISIRELLLKYTDIMHFPKKSFLRHLADFCDTETDCRNLLFLSGKAGSSDYIALANGHASLIDFLHTFSSCKPSLECLLSHLPLLHPRFYSVCSASDRREKVEFIYSCMDYTLPNGSSRQGVCSSWLERIKSVLSTTKDFELSIIPRPSQHFRLPEDPTTPMIMICAGTGVSPFVGFLRTLALKGYKMDFTWLIYGFRHRSNDFLFADELASFEASGLLSKLTIAVSREPESGHPKYVQDALRKHSEELFKLIREDEKSKIYICGDELTMIRDVNSTIQEILQQHKDLTTKEAQAELNALNANKRIIRDVWA